MSEELVTLGIVLMFIAMLLIIVGSILGSENGERKVEVGVGGFIGPIPFGWASSPGMLKFVILISLIAMISFLLMFLLR